jgi:hypothetical protein
MRVSLPVDQFLKRLGIDYEVDEDMMSMNAYEQARDFIREWVNEENTGRDEDDLISEDDVPENVFMEVLTAIEWAMQAHWSPARIAEELDIDGLVDAVNQWSRRGMQMNIYQRKLHAGEGISGWGISKDGNIWFDLKNPFLIAYIEAAYCVLGVGDEGEELEDMEGRSVAATMRRIAECEGWKIRLDLDRHDESRSGPTWVDLSKIMDKEWPKDARGK